MSLAERERLDIDKLLGSLHRKKRWLDVVIVGLECAIESPENRFIDAVRTTFTENAGPHVDLTEEKESLLRNLAIKVPRRSRAVRGKGRKKARETG